MDARDLLEQKDFVPPEIKDIEITDAAINRLLQVGYKQVGRQEIGGFISHYIKKPLRRKNGRS